MKSAVAVLVLFLFRQSAEGFSAASLKARQQCSTSSLEATSGRRAFLDASLKTAASAVLVSPVVTWADETSVDDLAMPSEDEVKKAEVSLHKCVSDTLSKLFHTSPYLRLFCKAVVCEVTTGFLCTLFLARVGIE